MDEMNMDRELDQLAKADYRAKWLGQLESRKIQGKYWPNRHCSELLEG
jgi:hypothetical protein